MNDFRRKVFLLAVTLLFSVIGYAAITLPAIVASHMVLQRNAEVTFWGWADAQEEIIISTSWLADDVVLKADKEGKWKVVILTTDSKEIQTIQLKSSNSEILLEDVLFGEVWLCSGQSNMEMPVNGFKDQPSFGIQQAILEANNPNLRLFTVERKGTKQPLEDLDKYRTWAPANARNVPHFSAVAYYYGQKLQKILDVPVGLIHTSWGGSSIQAWMSKEALDPIEPVDLSTTNIENGTNHKPTVLFNAMLHPLIPFSIKGVLWYQGESNRMFPKSYEALMPAMVKDWRTRWGLDNLAFYYVQIAPFKYGGNELFNEVGNSAFIRESQLKCKELIPNSGIAITMDIGDEDCIHPPMKKEVADRLLYNALSQTYGWTTLDGQSPEYDALTVGDGALTLKFKNAENGLFAYGELRDFEIAGKDRIFYPATATIVRQAQSVLVKSDKVPQPVAVRYAWRNFVEGTLFDTNGLPASSFRTDDWDDATRTVEY